MRTGHFREDTIDAYFKRSGSLYDDKSVVYWLDPAEGNVHIGSEHHTVCETRQAGTTLAAEEVGRLLYMDVGCWLGSGSSVNDTSEHWGGCRSNLSAS